MSTSEVQMQIREGSRYELETDKLIFRKQYMALSLLQMAIGMLCFVLGITAASVSSPHVQLGTGIWTGLCFFIPGFLGTCAGLKRNRRLIVACMVMNIIGSCVAWIGILTKSIFSYTPTFHGIKNESNQIILESTGSVSLGETIVILSACVGEFFISITLCILSCGSICLCCKPLLLRSETRGIEDQSQQHPRQLQPDDSDRLRFRKQHKVFGIIQMVIGLICFAMDIVAANLARGYLFLRLSGILAGPAFFISGLLGVIASKTENLCFGIACMVMNIIGSCAAVIGITFAVFSIGTSQRIRDESSSNFFLIGSIISLCACIFEFFFTIIHSALACGSICICCKRRHNRMRLDATMDVEIQLQRQEDLQSDDVTRAGAAGGTAEQLLQTQEIQGRGPPPTYAQAMNEAGPSNSYQQHPFAPTPEKQ